MISLEDTQEQLRQANEALELAQQKLSDFEREYSTEDLFGRLRWEFRSLYLDEEFPLVNFLNGVKSYIDDWLSKVIEETKAKGGVTTGRYIFKSDADSSQQLGQKAKVVSNSFLAELDNQILARLQQELRKVTDELDGIYRERAKLTIEPTHLFLSEWKKHRDEVEEANKRIVEAQEAHQRAMSEIRRTERQAQREALLELHRLTIQQSKLHTLLGELQLEIDYFVSLIDMPLERQGVYLLWRNNSLEYVGRTISQSARMRLAKHGIYKESQSYLVGIVFIEEDNERDRIEKLFIRELLPIRNRAGKPSANEDHSDELPV
jgi:hypothetical protein